MPTKNIIKQYGEEQYYHVYNRGVAKMDIFRESLDYTYFLGLLKRHLSKEIATDKIGRPIPNYTEKIDLVAYCLMPNHYHMLVYLKEKDGLEKLMRSVMTAYSMYFNKKYKRVGSLFQNHFLASRITGDEYLWHVSRYIHLNPLDLGADFRTYKYSSISYFTTTENVEWLHDKYLVETAAERDQYMKFTSDYQDAHQKLAQLKHQLANEP